MYMVADRSPSEKLLPTPSTEIADDDVRAIEVAHKIAKRRTYINRAMAAIGLTTLLSSPVNLYASDVRANQSIASLSTPSLDVLPGAEQDPLTQSNAIFYLAGFDTSDGSVFGQKVGIALQQITPGEDVSVNYGNAPLDVKEISTRIISYAEDEKLSTISLAGNSQGGIVLTDVAEYILQHSPVEIAATYFNATPTGLHNLRPETRENLDKMLLLLKLPESKYSTFARYAATMAQGAGRYTQGDDLFENAKDFMNVSNETWDLIREQRRPGMWLLADQANAIINADMKGSFASIGELRGEKRMPYVVVMRPQNPMDDEVVDVEQSSSDICEYAELASLQCRIVEVENSPHTSWDFNTTGFTEALSLHASEIKNGIKSEAILFSLAQRALYATDHQSFGE